MYRDVTARQIECLQTLLDLNGDTKEAASQLGITIHSFKSHMGWIYTFWDVNNHVAAIKAGLLNGKLVLR